MSWIIRLEKKDLIKKESDKKNLIEKRGYKYLNTFYIYRIFPFFLKKFVYK